GEKGRRGDAGKGRRGDAGKREWAMRRRGDEANERGETRRREDVLRAPLRLRVAPSPLRLIAPSLLSASPRPSSPPLSSSSSHVAIQDHIVSQSVGTDEKSHRYKRRSARRNDVQMLKMFDVGYRNVVDARERLGFDDLSHRKKHLCRVSLSASV